MMTWIVGVNTSLGYSFALSDIKVSWGSNIEIDCLQKFYPITNNIGAGFAGSVNLGFKMLEGLARSIQNEKDKRSLIPDYIINKWSRQAKRIFSNAPLIDRQLGCQLLMIATYPVSKITIGQESVSRTALFKMSAPDFKPYKASQNEIVSIGSGSKMNEYNILSNWIDENINEVYKFTELIGLQAAFNILLSSHLETYPKFGISKHLHIITANQYGISIGKNDRQNDDGSYSLKMPPVAQSYPEFLKIAQGNGFKGESASAR